MSVEPQMHLHENTRTTVTLPENESGPTLTCLSFAKELLVSCSPVLSGPDFTYFKTFFPSFFPSKWPLLIETGLCRSKL